MSLQLIERLAFFVGSVVIVTAVAKIVCNFLLRLQKTKWNRYLKTVDGSSSNWAIVTGGTDGIGLEFCIQLARKGFNIVIVGRNKERLESARDKIHECASQEVAVELYQFDFSTTESTGVEELTRAIIKDRKKIIRVLVNNVGASHGHPEFFYESDPSTIETILMVNAVNTVRFTHSLFSLLKTEKHDSMILNIGSVSGNTPTALLQTYSAAKAFLKTWSIALSQEMSSSAPHVRVHLLDTHYVASKMSKIRRTSFFVPSPRKYVQSALSSAGCYAYSTPYLPHALLSFLTSLMPDFLFSSLSFNVLSKVRHAAIKKSLASKKTKL